MTAKNFQQHIHGQFEKGYAIFNKYLSLRKGVSQSVGKRGGGGPLNQKDY